MEGYLIEMQSLSLTELYFSQEERTVSWNHFRPPQ